MRLFAACILGILFQASIRHPNIKKVGRQPTNGEFLGLITKVTNQKNNNKLMLQKNSQKAQFQSIFQTVTSEKALRLDIQQRYEQQGISIEYFIGQ